MKRPPMMLVTHILGRSAVEKRPRQTACLVWQGAKTQDGYGNVKWDKKNYATHRVIWINSMGTIPKGKWVRHHCGNRACVEINHLYLSKRGRQAGI